MKNKSLISVLLVVSMLLTLTGCGKSYPVYSLAPDTYLELQPADSTKKPSGSGGSGSGSDGPAAVAQLTADDIQNMNGGKARMTFSDEGYLTFLNGRFYAEKVTNYEEAVQAVQGVAQLLGLGAGSEFFALGGSRDDEGNIYYTFQQRYGDYTIQYATLRVVIDPEGYTRGLSCSFTPNIGIAEPVEGITPQQAEQVVRDLFPRLNLTVYSEYTKRTVVTTGGMAFNAYAVYTNNPNASVSTFDMNYMEFFITVDDGKPLYWLQVASPLDYSVDSSQAEEYFKGLEQYTLTVTARLYNGATEELVVPVAYNPSSGLYYLADLKRKIMVSDFNDFVNYLVPGTVNSKDGVTWDNNDLLAYDRYIKAYDFFASMGIYSTDGCGTPIMVCTGYCDEKGNPVNNAGHCGIQQGWVIFGVSDLNTFSEAMDVVGHEFTHGVTSYSMGGMLYANDTGAINEAFSDIMGNICEMMTGSTADTTWLVGENCGTTMRSMSSPNDYNQPVSKTDRLFYPPTDNPDFEKNDNGGVHVNNSLLSQMAYKLWAQGMSLADESALWITTIELMTPLSGYKEVHEAMLMSVEINGLDENWKVFITDMFNQASLL